MALISTINFLPQIFRSGPNQRFIGATLDQLASDSYNTPVNGYIGRTFAPVYRVNDNYVSESTKDRKNYQLESSVVVKDNNQNTIFNAGYIDLLQSIKNYGGLIDNHQRLFKGETYNYDGHFDYDKFVNYNNYYWLPNGPAAVSVVSSIIPFSASYAVTRNTALGGYTFAGQSGHPNTQITLARGGSYTFEIDQTGSGEFWIQTLPGVSGTRPSFPQQSTRNVFGVTNNGISKGSIQFNVPQANAQDFYTNMPVVDTVTAAVDFDYADIQGKSLFAEFLVQNPTGLDGVTTQLQGKTFIFVNNSRNDADWTANGTTVPTATRSSIWQISLIANGADYTIDINPVQPVVELNRVFVSAGDTYAGIAFWLNRNLIWATVPEITAPSQYLYYQDSNNPDYYGEIKIIDTAVTPIDVENDILGRRGYTSPNQVVFTNGLKIRFDNQVTPATYANNEYYVEGVGTAIKLAAVSELTVPESWNTLLDTKADYITINRSSQDQNPWSRSNRWFHQDVITATAKYNQTPPDYGNNLPGRRAIIEFEAELQLFNFGRLAKANVDIIDFTPGRDAFNDIQGQQTYTIDGVSLTTGSRIIFATDADITVRNQIWRVQIERINLQPYIRLIPADDADIVAGNNVLARLGSNAAKTFRFDGSNWTECQTKTKLNQPPRFDVVDLDHISLADPVVYPNSTFVGTEIFGYAPATVTAGMLQAGTSYTIASVGNTNFVAVGAAANTVGTVFVATGAGTGTGTATNNNQIDPLLGFPLTYQNFTSVGDIIFENYFALDTFAYSGVTSQHVSTGYLVKNVNLDTQTLLNTWIDNIEPAQQYQIITKFFDNRTIAIGGVEYAFVQIDVLPEEQQTVPHLKVYLNNVLLTQDTDYKIQKYGIYDVITLSTLPALNDKIDVVIFSNSVSEFGYYEIPKNLDFNPLNEDFTNITLGQLRSHYAKLIENTSAAAQLPLQDQSNKMQGGTLLQHSSPVIYAMTFLNDPEVNFIGGVDLARKEYTRFKNKFLSLCSSLSTLNYNDPVTSVDTILQNINLVKNGSFPWYYSDMVPQGAIYNETVYTIENARQTLFQISSIFNDTVLSNRAVLIYYNGTQLVKDVDYVFSNISPGFTLTGTITLTVGDTITVRDYPDTDGNYVPETPSKLGLYPKFQPARYLDSTYQTPTFVIRGHDGSITPAFNDFRDDFLLELENRIYNNIKATYVDTNDTLSVYNIVPGRFRNTDYSLVEWNKLLSQNFLNWVGGYGVDYTSNEYYDSNNSWTWNYDTFSDAIDGSLLQGSWRAIYNYWYDTDTPNLTPWKMLGIDVEPVWWQERYGEAPYTGGNTTLWEDLEAGFIWNGSDADSYYDARFVRKYTNPRTGKIYKLTDFIPVDNSGNLLRPTDIGIIQQYGGSGAASFAVGEQGPAETAWRRSSDFPYALQVALALARPAKYFSAQLDTSRFSTNSVTGQFSNVTNQKINPYLIAINGDNTTVTGTTLRTSGYINWITDYVKSFGYDAVTKLNDYFKNYSVRLSYKVAGFTDKKLINVTAEQTSPGSNNASVVIPDDNYEIYLGKPRPTTTAVYSAVIVEIVDGGYSVTGYDNVDPFFTIIPSVANSNATSIGVNKLSVKVYQDSTGTEMLIPYGTVFATVQQVGDFLISYQRYLTQQGFLFSQFDNDLNTVKDFSLSTQEFLYWVQQGWTNGTIIVLNPVVDTLLLTTQGTVADEIDNLPNGSKLLNQNFGVIKNTSFDILRLDSLSAQNRTEIRTVDNSSIAFARLKLIAYEHTLIFSNIDNFNNIIYVPSQGSRQFRLKISGAKTGAWNGALSAPGYVYSDPIIATWQSGVDYKLGDLITLNGRFYTAPKNIVAAQQFNINDWTEIAESAIQTGLLPSLGQNAQQFQNFYDVDYPPQNEDLQIFSAGLIGFRPRPFLSNLGISVPTQTKFYQGYIKEKGSNNAVQSLITASFNNVGGSIDIYEEWGFRVATYGDVNNNQYREFILDQSAFSYNPVAFTLTANTFAPGTTIANLSLANIYLASNLSSHSTALYNNRVIDKYTTDLPTPGYVNVDDVDYQLFDISLIDTLPEPRVGDKIWVAKDTERDWNTYRINATNLVATTLTYTLDTYATLLFNNPHSFNKGSWFILKDFDDAYNGLYQVTSVPNQLTVVIRVRNVNQLIKTSSRATGSGSIYSITSTRVNQVHDIEQLQPVGGWIDWDRVWVDNAITTGWGVYTFNRPWKANAGVRVTANTIQANAKFGTGVRISSNQQFIYTGGVNGVLQVFANVDGRFIANATLSNTASGFGSVIESQGNLLVVAAPDNNSVRVYRHNDSTTNSELIIPWTGVIPWTTSLNVPVGSYINYVVGAVDTTFVTTGNVYGATFTQIQGNAQAIINIVPWQPNLSLPTGIIISYIANAAVQTYQTTGNVYANAFSYITANITPYANVNAGTYANVGIIRSNILPIGSLISYQGNTYITTSANIGTPYFANIVTSGNVQAFSVSATDINLLQTITSYNNSGLFGTGVSLSEDRHWLFIGQPLDQLVQAYYTDDADLYNATYSFVSNIQQVADYDSFFGNVVRSNHDGSRLFVSAPKATNIISQIGNVYVYNRPIDFPSNAIPAWSANTVFGANSYISHNGEVFRVAGNVFAGNVAWESGVIYTAGSNVYYAGNTYQFLYTTSTTSLSSLLNPQPAWAPNTIFSNIPAWTPYNSSVPVGTYLSNSGSSYLVTGNIYGASFSDAPVQANVQYAFAGTSSQFVTFNGNTYEAQGNIFSPSFGYLIGPQPTWSSNTAVQYQFVYFNGATYYVNSNTFIGTRTWTANTALSLLPNNSYIGFNGNTYFTTGNVFAPNRQWFPGQTFATDSNVFYNGGSYRTTANVFYANVQWAPNTTNAIGSNIAFGNLMYNTIGNVFGLSFANVSQQQTVWTPNTTFANLRFVFHSNISETVGNTYRVLGNVNGPTFTSIMANLRFAYSGTTAVTLISDLRFLTNASPNGINPNVAANVTYLYAGNDSGFNTIIGNVRQIPNANVEIAKFGNLVTQSNVTSMYSGELGLVYAFAGNVGVRLLYAGNDSGFAGITSNLAPVYQLTQTISPGNLNSGAQFGTSLDIDATANNLFIGAPGATIDNIPQGLVTRYVYQNGSYELVEDLSDTVSSFGERLLGLFGSAVSVTPDAKLVTVGGYGGAGNQETVFDNQTTVLDAGSMNFVDRVLRSGTVFVFEPLFDLTDPTDVGNYNYIQELASVEFVDDRFGYSVDATRSVIAVGAPQTDPGQFVFQGDTYINYVTSQNYNAGNVHIFYNNTASTGWTLSRSRQPKVDIDSINRTLMYNRTNNNILAAIDFIDPAKGKVLSSVDRDIDYKRIDDPAVYNSGSMANSNMMISWGPGQVGRVWWDLDAVRYIDYEQETTTYRLSHWGETFPGSEIKVYEWVESSVPPSQYETTVGDGVPLSTDDTKYATYGYVDQAGTVKTKYYFWVSDKTTINVDAGKNNSVYSIAASIKNPQSQGIAYAEVLRDDTVALYNVNNKLTGTNSVIHLGGRSTTAGLIHNEYALVQEGNPQSQIPTPIQDKFVDSLSGIDAAGNPVPDPALPPAQAYGISIRPRQSMFIDRNLAVSNYITLVNTYLLTYPVVERKVLTILNSSEAVPTQLVINYSQTVNTIAELNYINTDVLSVNYQILVLDDSTNQGKWAIYQWSGTEWQVALRVDGTPWIQNYKTDLYWNTIDWYSPDYAFTNTSAADVTVANNLELGKIKLTAGTYVKILDNGASQFVVYYVNADLSTSVVAIQNGTIQISTGTIPNLEMRQIALAMRNQILITDLAKKYNELFFALIKYALSEQKNIDWVFKTSFISATQNLRKLQEFISYIPDNQSYYQEYIDEVKPYRTVLREFLINYQGDDQYDGYAVDFDIPPYYDANIGVYRSPDGSQSTDAALLKSGEYQEWSNNYTYRLVDVTVFNPGSGFASPPVVDISGGGGTGANAYAVLDGRGGINRVVIVDPGTGYTTLPNIRFIGTGTGAQAYPVLRNIYDGNLQISNLGHNLIRNIKTTVKFDRISYEPSNNFVAWDRVTSGNIGQVILANTVIVNSGSLFSLDIGDWAGNTYPVDALFYFSGNTYKVTGTTLTFGNVQTSNVALNTIGARAYTITGNTVIDKADLPIYNITPTTSDAFTNAIDRIAAFSNIADYALTQTGIKYPGVIVEGGNLNYSGPYDSSISSLFTTNLGVAPEEIDIDGGRYVDTYESHAPEELIPGRMFDSLNLQVEQIDNIKFRMFDNMQTDHGFYRIRDINTTNLTANLSLIDTIMQVSDPLALPGPDRVLGIPGVVFVNGEKIHYYRNYAWELPTPWAPNTVVTVGELVSYNGNTFVATGNVFDRTPTWANSTSYSANSFIFYDSLIYRVSAFQPNVNAPTWAAVSANANVISSLTSFANISGSVQLTNVNVLTQLRRAVDGTAPQPLHPVGSAVVDSSIQQLIPDSETTTYTPFIDTTFQTTDRAAVSFGLILTSRTSGNIGDTLTQVTTVPFWSPNSVPLSTLLAFAPNATSVSTYTVTGNSYARYFTDVSTPQPTWIPNVTSSFGSIPWTANATLSTIPTGTYVTYLGNTYLTTGNVYAPYFGNIIGVGNTNPTWTPFTTYQSGTFVRFGSNTWAINAGANVYASDFDVISANSSPVWAPNTVISTQSLYYNGDTYTIQFGANVYAQDFANISANNNPVWAPNTVISTQSLYYAGNTYLVEAGANIFARNFANITANNNPVWAPFTVVNSEYVYADGDTYFVNSNANIYVGYFANVTSNNNPVWMANTVINSSTIYYTGDTYTVQLGANVYAEDWANITANNSPAWQPLTPYNYGFVYYQGSTYHINSNAFGTTFANVTSNANVTLAFTGSSAVSKLFDGPIAANLMFRGGTGADYAFGGDSAVSTLFTGDRGVQLAWTAPTLGNTNLGFRETTARFTYYSGNTYSIIGNIYAPYFANISQQQPTWLANTTVTPVPTWTINTNTRSGYIYHSGNSYTVSTANVSNPGVLLEWTANAVIDAPLIRFGTAAYRVIGNVYGASFANANVQANLSTDFTANIYSSSFANISTPAMVWVEANVMVSEQEFISFADTTYQVKGNIFGAAFADDTIQANLAFAWNGSTAVTFAFPGDTTGYLYYTANAASGTGNTYTVTGNVYAPYFSNINVSPWVANVAYTANTYVWNANVGETYGKTYITTGNAYAPFFANVSQQQPTWRANAVMTPVPTWTLNTNFANLTYVFNSGNSYLVTGNVYGVTFGAAAVQANVALSFAGNTTPYIFSNGNTYTVNSGANIWAPFFANISANNNPVWTSGGLYPTSSLIYYATEGNTYVVLNNAFGTSFETVKSNANVTLAFVGNTAVQFAWSGNAAVSFAYEGGANVQLAYPGNATVRYAYTGNTALDYAFAGNTYITATFRLLETKANANVLPVIVTAGGIGNLPDSFDNPIGFDVASFDNASQELYVAGIKVQTFVRNSYTLGTVGIDGAITVPRGTTLTTANVWYDRGAGTATNGRTLGLSTTPQVRFLQSLT
jgi:hypothetical protein